MGVNLAPDPLPQKEVSTTMYHGVCSLLPVHDRQEADAGGGT